MWRDGDNRPNPTLNRSKIKQVIKQMSEPRVTREVTELIFLIYNRYEKSNLKEIPQSAHQLHGKEQVMILCLLKDFKDLFDGTLVKWNTYQLEIDLNSDAKHSSSRYYPVPHINKEMLQN